MLQFHLISFLIFTFLLLRHNLGGSEKSAVLLETNSFSTVVPSGLSAIESSSKTQLTVEQNTTQEDASSSVNAAFSSEASGNHRYLVFEVNLWKIIYFQVNLEQSNQSANLPENISSFSSTLIKPEPLISVPSGQNPQKSIAMPTDSVQKRKHQIWIEVIQILREPDTPQKKEKVLRYLVKNSWLNERFIEIYGKQPYLNKSISNDISQREEETISLSSTVVSGSSESGFFSSCDTNTGTRQLLYHTHKLVHFLFDFLFILHGMIFQCQHGPKRPVTNRSTTNPLSKIIFRPTRRWNSRVSKIIFRQTRW